MSLSWNTQGRSLNTLELTWLLITKHMNKMTLKSNKEKKKEKRKKVNPGESGFVAGLHYSNLAYKNAKWRKH